jgi:soluble lytic murein transglycosylase
MALISVPAVAAPDDQSPREVFRAADEALRNGEDVDVATTLKQLGDYPLAPYLRYRQMLGELGAVSADEVLEFRSAHPDLPVVSLLEYRWLDRAGEKGNWDGFRRVDRGRGGGSIACYRLQARRAADGVDEHWLERARDLWTVGYSQPSACDPVFAVLYERSALSAERRWTRIRKIMQAGHSSLARALRRRLEPDQQQWLDRWLRIAASPGRELQKPGFDTLTPKGRTIVRDAFHRLARTDPQRAMELLGKYRREVWILEADANGLQRYIALRGAYDRHPLAQHWLDGLPDETVDSRVREWRARVALGRQDWARLRRAVAELEPGQRRQPEWQYWGAVAMARTGDLKAALEQLRPLASTRHYYGFLAADLLGRPYSMNDSPAGVDPRAVRRLAERPGLVRAHEFFRLNDHEAARREWFRTLAGADRNTWADAAQLAIQWGWYARAVQAANRAGLRNALDLRFPLAFSKSLPRNARQASLDPALVYALARKESAFDPGAVSPVGARGLLQVMPYTADRVARQLGEPEPDTDDLLKPALNLRLGTAYLKQLLRRFDGSLVMAAAAYNAGPERVEEWRRENAGQPAPVWIENITYGETRDYVKSILAFRAVFDWRLRGKARSLTEAMALPPGEDRRLALRVE